MLTVFLPPVLIPLLCVFADSFPSVRALSFAYVVLTGFLLLGRCPLLVSHCPFYVAMLLAFFVGIEPVLLSLLNTRLLWVWLLLLLRLFA